MEKIKKEEYARTKALQIGKALEDNEIFKKYLFSTIFEMKNSTIEFINKYNFEKRLKSLSYKTPAQYLKDQKGILIQRIVIQQL